MKHRLARGGLKGVRKKQRGYALCGMRFVNIYRGKKQISNISSYDASFVSLKPIFFATPFSFLRERNSSFLRGPVFSFSGASRPAYLNALTAVSWKKVGKGVH